VVSFRRIRGGFPNKLDETGAHHIHHAPQDSAEFLMILKPVQEQFRAAFRIQLLQMFN
jgi:hypothetical protein